MSVVPIIKYFGDRQFFVHVGIQPEIISGLALAAGSSLIFQTSIPNFALLKNRNLLAHHASKLIRQTGKPIAHQFIELPTVDSTNKFALAMVHEGKAEHGTVYFAHEQTEGRGQRGRAWLSSPNENIIMSVVLAPLSSIDTHQFLLSMAMACAAFDFIHEIIPENLSIKWPNDLYWRDDKVGGILIENIIRGKDPVGSVAGFGININQTTFDRRIPNPASLKKITGLNYDPRKLAKTLCGHIGKYFEWLKTRDENKIIRDYNERLYKRNSRIELKKGQKKFFTTIKSVSIDGILNTEAPNGKFNHGEVDWVL